MSEKINKKLFSFIVNKKVIEKTPIEKILDNKPVTVLEDVEKTVSYNYFIKKPNRTENNDAQLFESIEFSILVKKGVITRSEIIKKFTAGDDAIEKIYKAYAQKENELQRLSLQEKTNEIQDKISTLQQELLSLLIEIQDFELTKSSIFNRTADSMARNKTIFWWILNLCYRQDGDKEISLFEGKDFAEKQQAYDKFMDDVEERKDEHLTETIQRFYYLIAAWYSGNVVTSEDFKKLDGLLKAEMDKNKINVQLKKQEEEKLVTS